MRSPASILIVDDDPTAIMILKNALEGLGAHPLLKGLEEGAEMYFTHSFAFTPADPSHVIASVDHGGRFAAAVARDTIMGVQFHPEKSQTQGLRLLANFLETPA